MEIGYEKEEELLLGTLASLADADPPEDFHRRAMARIAREKPLFFRILDKARPQYIAACFAAGLLVLCGSFALAGSNAATPELMYKSTAQSDDHVGGGMSIAPALGGATDSESESIYNSGEDDASMKLVPDVAPFGTMIDGATDAPLQSQDVESGLDQDAGSLKDSSSGYSSGSLYNTMEDASAAPDQQQNQQQYQQQNQQQDQQQMEMYVSEYFLTVQVDDVEAALAILDGYRSNMTSLQASLDQASISLELFDEQVDEATTLVKSLGIVTDENHSESSVTSSRVEASAVIAARKKEADNIRKMLNKAENIPDMLALSTRLEEISSEIDTAYGTLNSSAVKSLNPIINITLTTTYKPAPAPVPESLGTRIANAFITGTNTTVSALSVIALVLAQIAIPLLVIAVIVIAAVALSRKSKGGRKRGDKN